SKAASAANTVATARSTSSRTARRPTQRRRTSPKRSRWRRKQAQKRKDRLLADVTLEQIKELRELTGAGVMDCKRALEASNGNIANAVAYLTQQGIAMAEKRAGREASQGVVESYIHAGGRMGALVEINCETDFVARTDEFRKLAHEIAMQVA